MSDTRRPLLPRPGSLWRRAFGWGLSATWLLLDLVGIPAVADEQAGGPVRGVLRSVHESTVGSDILARIEQLPFHDGQRFAKGAVIVAFDCAKYTAELRAAEAEYRGHDAAYQSSLSMQKMQAAGALDVAVARAQADKAKAVADGARVRVTQCSISAPFDGRVVDVLAHEFDMPAPNAPLVRIVDDRNIEIDLIVPSKWLRWVREGAGFTFALDETGVTLPARVARIGAAVDPVSQTVKLTGVFAAEATGTLPGMSGTAEFLACCSGASANALACCSGASANGLAAPGTK